MSAVKSVRLALDVATTQRDDAGRALVHKDGRHRAALAQMQQLESYAADTGARWSPSTQARPALETVHHYYQFMERLQEAINLQHGVVVDLAREVDAARQSLLQAEIRIAGLNHLLKAKLAVVARGQSVREQKQMDEFAAVAYRRMLATLDNEEHHEH